MPILNELPEKVKPDLLLQLLKEYDSYIQNAVQKQCFNSGWVPLSIDEFFDTEFQLLSSQEIIKPVEKENKKTAVQAARWSTFSKNEIKKPRKKPWWLKWLP
ncbi:hypothetical protein JOC37_002601 [Desulfohalotomaculum tongense]|uniref:hypothetical protein n=1 Tax=Desulforadius tongensis TaxID=1216062 RepID=UPI00195E59C9|nr:hypothetical protein [Desulforadius tongensis]MBM7856168.1 hypothetical protein [Desulforadius tongensis]